MALVGGITGGCATGSAVNPVAETMASLLGSTPDFSGRAADLPYASMELTAGHSSALVVLAYIQGDDPEYTYWQSSNRVTFQFRDGRPFATAGLEGRLLSLERLENGPPTPQSDADTYRVRAHWVDPQDQEHVAVGEAHWACAAPASVELPLRTLELRRCEETIRWEGFGRQVNVFHLSPDSQRVWAGETRQWPGGPALNWQVARPWWSATPNADAPPRDAP
jgi:hypothetical protein